MLVRKRGLSLTGKGLDCGMTLCQTEVKDFGVTATGDKNIGGFDVAVNDAPRMGSIERIGNVCRQREEGVELKGPLASACLSV